MKLIAGLGNPGPRYSESRHNIGFLAVDELARRWKASGGRFDRDFQGEVLQAQRGAHQVLLLKPATFMNLSGQSVAAVCRFYKLPLEEVLIVYDDLDLPPGKIRLRPSGSAGGHRGLASVLGALGSQDCPRLRVGIGKVHRSATVDFVLGRIEAQEREVFSRALTEAAEAIECWVDEGMTTAMNRFNRRPDSEG